MPIPTLPPPPGVLPPFVGQTATERALRAPYRTTLREAADCFGTSQRRADIFRGLLRFRAELRGLPLKVHQQWLAGSYVEALSREPNDVDVVTFYSITEASITALKTDAALRDAASALFDTANVKTQFLCDAYTVNLSAAPIGIVQDTHYWYGLFSHQRGSYRWKGIVQVGIEDTADDAAAEALLKSRGF